MVEEVANLARFLNISSHAKINVKSVAKQLAKEGVAIEFSNKSDGKKKSILTDCPNQ